MEISMQVMRCGVGVALLVVGVTAHAAIDGTILYGRNTGGSTSFNWNHTEGALGFGNTPWYNGIYAREGGVATFRAGFTINQNVSGLTLGGIDNLGGNVTVNGSAFALTDGAFIRNANGKQLTISPAITGVGTVRIAAATPYAANSMVVLKSSITAPAIELADTILYIQPGSTSLTPLSGAVRLTGGVLQLQSDSVAGDVTVNVGSSFTVAPGGGIVRVRHNTASTATMNLGTLAREDRGILALYPTGVGTLGSVDFVKATGGVPAAIGGILPPWICVWGANRAAVTDFATYSDATGFLPFGGYAATLDAGADAVPSLTNAVAVAEDTTVRSLQVVFDSAAAMPFSDGATLTVGDGTVPAAIIFANNTSASAEVSGDGAIDFGGSEGLLWFDNANSGGRDFYLRVPVKGANGITFGSAWNADRAPIVCLANAETGAWKGPMHVRRCRLWVNTRAALPDDCDIWVDGASFTRSAQIVLPEGTYTNHFHLSGNGLQDSSDTSGAIITYGGAAYTLAGPVTLEADTTFYASGTISGSIDGPGNLTFQNGTFVVSSTNTYKGGTSVASGTLALSTNGTFGAGSVAVAGTVRFDGGTRTVTNALSGAGTVKLVAAAVAATGTNDIGTLAFDGNSANSMAGASTFTATDTTAAAVTGLGTVNGTELTVKSAAAGEFHATLAGSARLVKDGAGTLSVFSDVTSSGGVTVQGGTLKTVARLDAPFTDSLIFHLDATRDDTFKYAADGTITNWASTVGSVYFKSAGGVFTGPRRLATGWNELPVVKFEAVASNRLYSSVAVAPRTLFFVVRPRPDNMISCAGLFGQAGVDYNGVRAVTHLAGGKWTWDSGTGSNAHHVFDTDGTHIIDGGKAGYREIYNNQPQVIVVEKSDTNTLRSLSFTAGLGGYQGNMRNLDGDVAEVIAYDRILSEGERKRVENYLGRKWKDDVFYDGVESLSLGAGTISLAGDGVLDLAGSDVTVASLAGTGLITNSSDRAATLTVTGANEFNGVASGNMTIVCADGGTMSAAFADGATLSLSGGAATLAAYSDAPVADSMAWWLDAADETTITTNASGEVTRWASRCEGGVSFVQNGTRVLPVYTPVGHANAMGDGKPAVRFSDGDFRGLTSASASMISTVFFVIRTVDGNASCTGIWGVQHSGSECGIRYWTNPTDLQWCSSPSPFMRDDTGRMDGAALPVSTYGNTGTGTFPAGMHVLAFRLCAGHVPASRNFTFGCYHNTAKRCFNGWVCESIAYTRRLTDAEIVQTERYLAGKWKSAGAIAPNTAVGGKVTVASGATLTAAAGSTLSVGTLSGAGTISGDVAADGCEVTVKPNGTTDALTVNGTVTFNAGAYLQVFNPENLVNGLYSTFLDSAGISGTFSGSSLSKPCGWVLSATQGKVYRASGCTLIIR